MTTTLELIERTRQSFLLTGSREERDRLNTAIDNAVDTFAVEFGRSIASDYKLSVGLEDMLVWSNSSNTLTVDRGAMGSTALAHADKATVLINSWCSPNAVLQALKQAVIELDGRPGLFKVGVVELPISLSSAQIDLGDIDIDDILEVFTDATFDDDWERVRHWSLLRNTGANPVLDLSRLSLRSQTVRVVYRTKLGAIDKNTADVETTTGITNVNLLAVTAAISLIVGRPVQRTSMEAQPSTRRANEVAAFSTDAAARALERHQKMLLESEVMKLMQRYPMRRHNS